MKKIILTLSLLLSTLLSFSQDKQKFLLYNISGVELDSCDVPSYFERKLWCNAYISENIISFDSVDVTYKKISPAIDSTSDDYYQIKFLAMDDTHRKCVITMIDEHDYIRLIVEYTNCYILYEMIFD